MSVRPRHLDCLDCFLAEEDLVDIKEEVSRVIDMDIKEEVPWVIDMEGVVSAVKVLKAVDSKVKMVDLEEKDLKDKQNNYDIKHHLILYKRMFLIWYQELTKYNFS